MDKRYFRYFTYIQPVLRNPLVRTYGYIIFTIVMSIIFIIFAIKPTLETIVVLQKQSVDQKQILTTLTKKTQDLAQARVNYQAITPGKKAQLETALPKQVNIKSLIDSLEGSTLATQASISALQFQPLSISLGPAGQTTKEISFTFNVEGTYDDLKKILNSLYSSPRLISIDDLIFNRVEGGQTVLMSVSGKAFYIQ